jgi:hypothetical protein
VYQRSLTQSRARTMLGDGGNLPVRVLNEREEEGLRGTGVEE